MNVIILAALVLGQTSLNDAQVALEDCRLQDAVRHAEKARKSQDVPRQALELLAAIHDGRKDEAGARAVYAALKKLPAPPAPTAAPAAVPSEDIQPGSTRYVVATRVRLREKADARSKLVAQPPVNARVTVVAVAGDWLELTVEGGARGFMLARFTASQPVDAQAQLTRGREMARQQNWHEAFTAYDLAAALLPDREDVGRSMRGVAIRDGQLATAVQSCLPPPMEQRTLGDWVKMDAGVLGCEMEMHLGHRDPTYNCTQRRHSTGDPCRDTTAYYAGPAVPKSAARRIHPNIRSLTLTWEHGDVQAFQVCFVPSAPVDWMKSTVRGAARFPDQYGKDVIIPEDRCVDMERFDHMGAGDVDCGG